MHALIFAIVHDHLSHHAIFLAPTVLVTDNSKVLWCIYYDEASKTNLI